MRAHLRTSINVEDNSIVSHEIAGTATRVGNNVKSGIKVGDRVGVGAQIGSCYQCEDCKNDNENYCLDSINTYVGISKSLTRLILNLLQASKYPDGVRTFGGYSNGIIANEQYVFPIPDALESRYACSMLCGGLTVYSPLVRNGAGPGKKVGIVGIGGLVGTSNSGHLS